MDNFREEIRNKLSQTHDKGRILFAVLICERLYPNYGAFQKEFNWGNQEVLNEGIAVVRQYLIKEDLFKSPEIEELIYRIDNATPNTEDFPGIITSFALDACTSIYSTLNYILRKNLDDIADVASYARDTVDMYIQEKENLNPNDPKIEETIERNPFMIAEKNRQRDLLKVLSVMQFDTITDKVIENLRGDEKPIIDLRLLPNHRA